jgi:hypothetical protein
MLLVISTEQGTFWLHCEEELLEHAKVVTG